jgi:pilus assembly protein Flp/PilA
MRLLNEALLRVMARFESLSLRREEGQGLVEYALIIALVSVLLVASLTLFKDKIAGVFTSISSALT